MNGKVMMAMVGAFAVGGMQPGSAQPHQDGYAYAQVIDVQPVVRVVRIEEPRRECWTEEVTRHETRSDAGGMMIAGGLIGGLIGSQIGSGRGRDAATAAGALIGTAIGHGNATTVVHPRTSVERHCNVRTEYREEERHDGYRVTYEYGGAAYVTRMRHHPGDRLRVRVSVRPVSF